MPRHATPRPTIQIRGNDGRRRRRDRPRSGVLIGLPAWLALCDVWLRKGRGLKDVRARM
jgi:hypothetical protein